MLRRYSLAARTLKHLSYPLAAPRAAIEVPRKDFQPEIRRTPGSGVALDAPEVVVTLDLVNSLLDVRWWPRRSDSLP
ncbi:MAG: hypothetical protein CMJ81_18425 [Planctomycetaceae bacterium]|nr:hypothetical protein [Planctomycetaceae bacterium]